MSDINEQLAAQRARQDAKNDDDQRRPYEPPKLTTLGTLTELTQAVSGGSNLDRTARRGGLFKFPFRR